MIVYRNINNVDFAINPNKSASLLCEPDIAKEIKGSIYLFIDYIYKRKNKYIPLVATWELTNGCNFKCKFCYINTSNSLPKYIPFSVAKRTIDYLVDEGLLLVYLTGGEVLSHPDFLEIYKYLKLKGVYVVLLTNLSLLNDEISSLFEEYPPLRITVSIYGITDKQFESVTGIKKHFANKILDNVIKLKEKGVNITAQTPINTLTFPEYKEIADWCYSNGIIYTSNNELSNSYYNDDFRNYFVEDELYKAIKEELQFVQNEKLFLQEDLKCNFGYKYHFDCISGKHTFAISYNLHLRPCFNIWENEGPSFDGQESISKAMEEMKKYLETKKSERIEFCGGCVAHEFCSECMMTQNKNKKTLKKYMHGKCEKNALMIQTYKLKKND